MAEILCLAGINGAGKSSLLGNGILRARGATWFNPDTYARELMRATGMSQEEANSEAWAEGRRRLVNAIARGTDYAFETTLGANTIPRLLREACNTHQVKIWFIGLASPGLHIERVRARVARGGHDIPEDRIRSRYVSSVQNLVALMPGLEVLHVYDNSRPAGSDGADLQVVLEVEGGKVLFPATKEELAATPPWAQPVVARALELFPPA
ncbi:AAA family ATPase [Pseudoxanthomonas suwonensis]|uniref:AAA family ATPase n=1 Tax=Pseudoxanthomonas suwonensis TaxID=314722 RepID=UPI00138EEC19|nr:hypothetical protein [Pseudoxanthomonas suwonensis]KAF1699298.1 hypothetical protein CSC68_14930 [Pseudoxanthomonas suwonensis]